ncbi:MAG: anti-ECFsigma factor, ChrR [Frankiales bacterium]|nr:anti-ECFsigma factor, ChrR [Frankiales bacterium]
MAAGRVDFPPVSPAPVASSPTRIDLPNLLVLAQHPERIAWEPFQPGVEIHRLYGDGADGPSAALIRFSVGGRVPLHEHTGYEHILVLAGTQRDEAGTSETGALLIHPPGTRHRIVSDTGCIVLAIYERPVRFLE